MTSTSGGPAGRAVCLTAALLLGCTGQIAQHGSDPGAPGTEQPADGVPEPGAPGPRGGAAGGAGGSAPVPVIPAAGCDRVEPGPAPVRRLTRIEYDNTVRDLLGDTTGPARSFQEDGEIAGFVSNAETPVSTAS